MLSLAVLAFPTAWRHARRDEVLASGARHGVQPAQSQHRAVPGTNILRDTRDHISFSYPAAYAPDKAAAARWQKQAASRHATAHIVAWLTDKRNDADIVVMLVPVPFDLNYIRMGAPTGMEDWFWLRFTVFGENRFYFYSGGNQSVRHADQYFFNFNNTILTFTFDGPYSATDIVTPDWTKVGPIETLVLSSLDAPVKRRSPAPPGSFLYTNERYGFQLTLNSAWKGFKVSRPQTGNNGVTYLVFSVPSARYAGNEMVLIRLGVQSPQTWHRRRSHCGCAVNSAPSAYGLTGATLIGRTIAKVFSLEYWNADQGVRTKYQINRVIESFTVLR